MAGSVLLHLALKTPDLKATEEFYTSVLGMKVAFTGPKHMLFLCNPGGKDLLNFVEVKKKLTVAGLDHFGFKTTAAGLRRLKRSLAANNVAVTGRRGNHAIYFTDPNGYTIEYFCD